MKCAICGSKLGVFGTYNRAERLLWTVDRLGVNLR